MNEPSQGEKMKFRMEHVLPTDPNRAWKVIMSEEFARQSYAHSGTIREVLSEEERNGLIFMKLRIVVEKSLPPVAAKVLGATQLSWIQEQVIDNSKQIMQWKITIPSAKKVQSSGIFRIENHPDGALRTVEGDVNVKIPIVGKKAEQHICKQLEESYEKSAQFTQNWLRQNS